jgi:TRAP-type C4-dicarboxylate transport system substrate-binding protein
MPVSIRSYRRLAVILGLWLLLGAPAGAATVIKVALVTPEGSAWTNTLRRWAQEVASRTGGEVSLKIYAGGVSGDELDVLRKMRAGRIHAAGFSGVGLGTILPAIRILEAPLLFETTAEIDHAKNQLYDTFAADFERQGFVLLGFAEAGFVYLFAAGDLASPEALQQTKMWAWKGDPVAQTFLESMGVRTFPLHVTDVNTGLETGMIDAFYAPPLAAVAFQWYTRVRTMLDYPIVNSTGALLVTKRQFDRIAPEHQQILKETARRHCAELVRQTRQDNTAAMEAMAAAGIRRQAPSSELITLFKTNARRTAAAHVPALYPQELFERVQRLLQDYRQP